MFTKQPSIAKRTLIVLLAALSHWKVGSRPGNMTIPRTTSAIPSASLQSVFSLAGGYCGSSRLLALRLCHAAVLSASHSVSILYWDA
nr:unnamed protein product [Spirometra erinaceieuropaei]